MSALDALDPEVLAALEDLRYLRRLDYMLLRDGAYELLRQELCREVVLPNPAAGAEWSTVVPAGVVWELLTARVQLTTSAVVANRSPRIRAQDPDGLNTVEYGGATTAAAAQVNTYNWSSGYGATNTNISLHAPLSSPPAPIFGGWTVKSITGNIDAGDQYATPILLVREWSPGRVRNLIRSLMIDLESIGPLR